MKKFLPLIIVIVVVAAGIGVAIANKDDSSNSKNTSSNNTNSPNPNTTDENMQHSSSSSSSSTPTSTNTVSIENFSFSPTSITVKKGTTVTWTNNDSAAHTVTSDSGTVLNSENLEKGESFEFTFNDTGTFAYHCAIHSSMTGKVTVTE